MNLLRKHNCLAEMLQRELSGVPNPRQAAAAIEAKTQTAESLVLFTNPAGSWLVIPVGPACELRNIGQAARAQANGRKPVAWCPRY